MHHQRLRECVLKYLSVFTAIAVLIQNILPVKLYALTGGSSSPEFSNFESVSTNNMVDPFTGDFTYNIALLDIPGPNGGGYPLSLSYHSGVTPEEEASWVGYGWTLNPGAIIRNKRGFADDLYAADVTYYNRVPSNTTFSLTSTTDLSIHAFGIPSEFFEALLSKLANASVGISHVLAYNSYKGITLQTIPYVSYQLGLKNTTISLEPGESLQEGVRYSYSYTNPMMLMLSLTASALGTAAKESKDYKSTAPLFNYISKSVNNYSTTSSSRLQAYSLHNNSFPASLPEYTGESYTFSSGGYVAIAPIPIGIGATLSGSYLTQNTNDSKTRTGYGYLYSDVGNTNDEAVLDFVVEKDDDFNLQDEILPIPFSSADDFTVVGEGISGVMRAYSSAPGEFFPAYTHSHTSIGSLGVHITVGATEAISADVGAQTGENEGQNISIGRWDDNGTNDAFDFTNGGREKYYFRFKGDMGGSASFVNGDAVVSASINDDSYKLSGIYTEVNDGDGVQRSTYVGYHTNEEMAYEDYNGTTGTPYNKYSFRDDIETLTVRSGTTDNLNKRIGEFEITNKQGIRYVYGLPLYAKNEKSISFSASTTETNPHIVYANEEDADRKFGHEVNARYASTYLLTEATTPNFIDVDHNGPDEGDFGGWTKFNYTKAYGENGESTTYYHWRSPYRGLYYNPGEYSKPEDDLGSYESGDREVAYVESIETATHIAVFELNDNTTEARKDGLSAATDATADNSTSAKGSQRLHYLKSIKLYAKDDDNSDLSDNSLIKTVHLEYDYSLMQNQPNSDGATGSSGKLTLKRVWYEYANVHNAGISPYTFEYAYPTDISYPSPFGNATNDTLNIVDLYSQYTSGTGSQQNPNYNADNTDVWGMYQEDGTTSHYNNFFPWVSQTPSNTFDPAAWHLKRIKLPTGAEIHVQYEQKEYAYVQNRKTMVMASVSGVVDHAGYVMGSGSYGAKYYLNNLDEAGITTDDTASLSDYIQENFIRKGQKIYFKFAYEISASGCGTEYISGYANVMGVGVEENSMSSHYGEFFIQLGNPDNPDEEGNGSPCEACQEYYRANKGLKFNDCDNTLSVDENDPEANILQLWGLDVTDVVSTENCQSMNTDGKSYLKIPLPGTKKGGGVRVKRLITYDPGIESDNADKRVYGNEYVYETQDGESSGVAANEPNREENAVIGYLQKRSESTRDQILVSGEDKQQFEGPVGEYLLPGPTIGYSRIVLKNIYSGKTNNGFTINTFYTAKDYPFDWGNTNDNYCGVTYSNINLEKEEENKFGIFVNKVLADYKATQGYRFVIPNMHGKPKLSMQYDGDYEDINNPTECALLASTEYNYFEPGEEIPVMTNYTTSGPEYGKEALGKETEIVCYSKKVEETVEQSHTTIEAGIMLWTPYTIPYALPFYMRTADNSYIKTHVTNQIIYFPPLVKSVTNYIDGTHRTISNKYFDPKTGDVLVQETSGSYDQLTFDNSTSGHEGKYYSYNLPAHFKYDGMGQKAEIEGYSFSSGSDGVKAVKYAYGDKYMILFSGSGYDDVLTHFTTGDVIELKQSGSSTKEIYNVCSMGSIDIILCPVSGFYSGSNSNNKEVELKIIKSGRANLLTTMAGNLIAYGNKDAILNASAATFSNQWPMGDEIKTSYGANSDNPIETGEAGKWHLKNSYSFWDDVTRMDNDVDNIYEAGILKNFSEFNWANTSSNNSKWKNMATCNTYTPNGDLCEEKNLYDIYSSNKMGYGGQFVYLDAQNAEYTSTLFESFEYNGGEEMEIASYNSLSEETAHSGNNSLKINVNATTITSGIKIKIAKTTGHWGYFNIISSRERTAQLKSAGIAVKMWVKSGSYTPTFTLRDASVYTSSGINGKPTSSGTKNFSDVTFESIARTGEWTLYEATITADKWADYGSSTSTVSNYGLQVYLETNNVYGTPEIYVDDIRVQPLNAKMNSYVYDPATFKVVASFDDQNFGLYYQYNDEGQLIRKQKETVKGMKTLVETQYHIPTQER